MRTKTARRSWWRWPRLLYTTGHVILLFGFLFCLRWNFKMIQSVVVPPIPMTTPQHECNTAAWWHRQSDIEKAALTESSVASNWTRRNESVVPWYPTTAAFLRMDDKEVDEEEARCYFHPTGLTVHFPHFMQQIYRCWSFFQSHGKSRRRLVLFPTDHVWFDKLSLLDGNNRRTLEQDMYNGSFVQGFLAMLEQKLSVTFRPRNATQAERYRFKEEYDVGFALQPADANALSRAMLPLWIHNNNPQTTRYYKSSSSSNNLPEPRIGILNRQKSRHLLNANELAEALSLQLGLSYAVPVVYFEGGVGFADQAAFFAETDILISPHGAQLTGLPFLGQLRRQQQHVLASRRNNKKRRSSVCAAPQASVVEIFPENICLPYYFGSLAVNSGHQHSYVTLGNSTCHYEQEYKVRVRFRRMQLCPNLETLVQAVRRRTEAWKRAASACTRR